MLVVAASTGCRGTEPASAGEPASAASGDTKGESPDQGKHAESESITLTPEQARVAGIAFAVVEERAEASPIEATATIEPAAERQARVGSRIAGRVVALRARVGDRVSPGQVLAVVDSPELGRARADFLAALAEANLARETAERKKALFQERISAEREWREADAEAIRARAERDAAENRLHALGVGDEDLPRLDGQGHLNSTMVIASPIGGLVVEAGATLGQIIEPKDTLFVVMDLRSVWLQVDVYEQDLAQVRPGERATVRLRAAPGETYVGVVDNVGAVVDPKSRTVKVRVVLENPRNVLRPGMFATATIEGTAGEKRRALYVPSAAVQRLGKENVVFVARSETAFEPRHVELTRSGKEWTEIARGLDAGERIVTRGSFALKSELRKDELGGEE
jgi:cobalt-zinc-cadmium efflux system membrane fusion protein